MARGARSWAHAECCCLGLAAAAAMLSMSRKDMFQGSASCVRLLPSTCAKLRSGRRQPASNRAPFTRSALDRLRCPPSRLKALRARRRSERNSDSAEALFVGLEDLLSTSEELSPGHVQQLVPIVESLAMGGMGVIPTDTQHAYVTGLTSKHGTRRIYDIKGVAADERKPLSLLCSDLSMASLYSDVGALPRRWFQQMKSCLPGPFTFILRASSEVPRVVLNHKSHAKIWKRREVGIRVPDCAIVSDLASDLGEPLLASSACDDAMALWNNFNTKLDFVVDASLPDWVTEEISAADKISTVIDLTMEQPVLRRQGMGDASVFDDLLDIDN